MLSEQQVRESNFSELILAHPSPVFLLGSFEVLTSSERCSDVDLLNGGIYNPHL